MSEFSGAIISTLNYRRLSSFYGVAKEAETYKGIELTEFISREVDVVEIPCQRKSDWDSFVF
jgi:hypothetical protein